MAFLNSRSIMGLGIGCITKKSGMTLLSCSADEDIENAKKILRELENENV